MYINIKTIELVKGSDSYLVFESLWKTRHKLDGRSVRIVTLDEHFGVLGPRRLTGRGVPLGWSYGRHFSYDRTNAKNRLTLRFRTKYRRKRRTFRNRTLPTARRLVRNNCPPFWRAVIYIYTLARIRPGAAVTYSSWSAQVDGYYLFYGRPSGTLITGQRDPRTAVGNIRNDLDHYHGNTTVGVNVYHYWALITVTRVNTPTIRLGAK